MRKLDPRVAQYEKQIKKEKLEKEKLRLQNLEEQKQRRMQEQREIEAAHARLMDQLNLEELGISEETDEKVEDSVLYCVACKRKFKSNKQ